MDTKKVLKSASLFNFKCLFFDIIMIESEESSTVFSLSIYHDDDKEVYNHQALVDIEISVVNDIIIVNDFIFYIKIDKEKEQLIEQNFIYYFEDKSFKSQDDLYSAIHDFAHYSIMHLANKS